MDGKESLFKKAERKDIPLKIALIGSSGSGKTYSALVLAQGIGGKTAVLDTENKRALHYADKFDYFHLPFSAPYNPERFVNAIKAAESEGIANLIIDSASHEWIGKGGILDLHSAMTGNSFANWGKLTPRHNDFLQAITDSPMNIICTIRGKDEYVLEETNGKQKPTKVGLGAQQRDGIEFEQTVSLMIDMNHTITCMKDTTGVFSGGGVMIIKEEHGEMLAKWSKGE